LGKKCLCIGSQRRYQNCLATDAHQQTLVSAQSCFGSMFASKKSGGDIIYFHPKIVRDLDVLPCKTGQCSKRTMDVDDKNIQK